MPTWQAKESAVHPPATQRLHALPRRLCAAKACPRVDRDESWLLIQDNQCVFCTLLSSFRSYRIGSDLLSLFKVNVTQLLFDEKRFWEVKARVQKAKHKVMYPLYRFRPVHKKKQNIADNTVLPLEDPANKRKEKQSTTNIDATPLHNYF